MKLIHTIEDLQRNLTEARAKGEKIGLVPTMGALHEGHASLVRRCVAENDVTVVSVFLNPTQFNDKKDDEKISFGSTFIFAVITDRIFYSGILLQRRLLCKYLDQRCLLYRKNGGGSEFGAFVAYRGSEYCHRGQRGDRVYNLSCGSRLSGRLQ